MELSTLPCAWLLSISSAATRRVGVIRMCCFRFVPTFGAAAAHWMDLLRALPAQIPELRSISVGTDALAGPFCTARGRR